MVNKKKIPGTPNFCVPSKYIDWEKSFLKVPKSTVEWDGKDKNMLCGVSSFGLSGTNAHLVVSEYKDTDKKQKLIFKEGRYPLKISAMSHGMLEKQLDSLLFFLDKEDDYYNATCSYNKTKANMTERLVLFASNTHEAKRNIQKAIKGDVTADIIWGESKKKCVFVFTGQGSQYPHMFENLYSNNTTFKKNLVLCDKYYKSIVGYSLVDIVFSDEEKINETSYTQPALFSVEYSIAKTWMHYGVEPEILLGHSVGEYVAACLAGVFTLEDAMKLIVSRGSLMQYKTPDGSMLAIYSSREETIELVGNNENISIAASNSMEQTVIAGRFEEIEKIKKLCDKQGIRAVPLKVSKAFHSPLMEEMLEDFQNVAQSITYHKPKYKVISNITGDVCGKEIADWKYWCQHITSEVKFCNSIRSICDWNDYLCIEMGPEPVLISFIRQITNGDMFCTYTYTRKGDSCEILDKCAMDLFLHGVDINWVSYYDEKDFNLIQTPNYIFEERKLNSTYNEEKVNIVRKNTLNSIEECRRFIKDLLISELQVKEEELSEAKNLLLLGANSVMIGRLLDVIKRSLKINLEIKEFIKHCTILDWTDYVWTAYRKDNNSEEEVVIPLHKENEHELFDLSEVQYAYWVGRDSEMEWGNVGCCAYFEIDIDDLDVNKFKNALDSMVIRHSMLRCVITKEGKQKVLKNVALPLIIYERKEVSDLSKHLDTVRNEMKYEVLPLEKPMFDIRLTEKEEKTWRIHFTIDFLIADAMSIFIFWNDFNDLYNGSTLPSLDITFKDYMYHTRRYFDSEKYKIDKAYWLNRIVEFPTAPQLPYRNSVLHSSNGKFIRRKEILEIETWNKFVEIAAKNNLTASAALLSLYSEILSAWGGGNRFAVMLTVFKRELIHEQVEQIIGDFTQLMLVEINREQVSYGENAETIQEQMQNDLCHSDYSALEFVNELRKREDTEKLYPIVFTSALGVDEERKDNIFLSQMEGILSSTPQVFLDHQVYKEKNGIALSWDIMDDIFCQGISAAMFESYIGLVKNAASDENFWQKKAIDLRPNKQKEIQELANTTQKNIPDILLHELFQKNVLKSPDSIAVVHDKNVYSYGKLQESANTISTELLECGIQVGDRVLIQMKKSYEQIAVVIAVVQIGAVYVPVMYDQPADRTNSIIANCKGKCIVIDEYNSEIRKDIIQIVPSHIGQREYVELPKVAIEPEKLGYIIYTSGSTGSPKGVCVSHKAAMNTILDINERNEVAHDDKVLSISSLSFDLSVYDIFGILSAGGTIVLPSEDQRIDPKELYELVRDYGVTLWNSVPALMEILADYINQNVSDIPITSLRHVFLSGDWIPLNLYDKVMSIFPKSSFVSMGGATEAAIWSIYYEVKGINPEWISVPYGKPLSNQQFYILDSFGRCCPEGVIGRLYIAGNGLANEYSNAKSLTEKAFVFHPTLEKRLYDTGDYGKYDVNGIIEFLGRRDDQIKINGYRIEKGEIIAAFRKIGVQNEVLIVPVGGQMDKKALLAYIKTDLKVDENELKSNLLKYVPQYLIPDRIISILEFPKTQNGKIDISLLGNESIIEKEQSDCECQENNSEVLRVIKKVLGQSVINLNRSFRDLGVSSVDMIRLANELELRFKVRPSVRELMTYSTIKQVILFYDNKGQKEENASVSVKMDYQFSLFNHKQIEFLTNGLNNNAHKQIQKELYICNVKEKVFSNPIWNDCMKEYETIFLNGRDIVGFKIYVFILMKQSEELGIGKYALDVETGNLLFCDSQISEIEAKAEIVVSACLELSEAYVEYGMESIRRGYQAMGMILKSVDTFLAYRNKKNEERYALSEVNTKYPENYFHLGAFTFVGNHEKSKLCNEERIKAENLLVEYNKMGIEIFNENNSLKYRAAKGKMTSLLAARLKENKGILMRYLEETDSNKDYFPVTPIQRAYILGRDETYELGNTSAHYYVELDWKGVNTEKLEKAINIVIQKNEILQTIITKKQVQYVLDEVPYYKLPIKKYETDDEILNIREKWSEYIFELGKWPMFYIQVSYLGNRRTILHFSFDCIILDGWSAEMLLQEIYLVYLGREIVKPQITFKQYILNEKDWLKNSTEHEGAVEYWNRRVSELPKEPRLPMRRNYSDVKKPHFKRLRYVLPKNLTKNLKIATQKYGFTLSAVICTAYMDSLARWTGRKEFTLNLTLFNRLPMHEDVEKILGEFTNIALIPYQNSENKKFTEMIETVQTNLWEAVEYREFDGMQLLRNLSKNSFGKAIMPVVFTSMLFGENTIDEKVSIFNEAVETYGISQTPQVALDHQALIRSESLVLIWDYVSELFEEESIKSMFEKYISFIKDLAQNENWNSIANFQDNNEL